jgi:dTDP-D-glucose 4,6-dehydratase
MTDRRNAARMQRYLARKAARPAELRHDKPGEDMRYYIHVRKRDGMCGWLYFEVLENGMLAHRYNSNAEFAEAFDRKDVETYCELTRFAHLESEVIAVKADSKQLIPDELQRYLKL